MTKLFLALVFSICCFTAMYSGVAAGQPKGGNDCPAYYPMTKGSEFEMQHFDRRDNITGTTFNRVLENFGNRITIESIHKDGKGKEMSSGTFEVICKDGTMQIDMQQFTSALSQAQFDDMDMEVTGSFLEMPSDLKVGQDLPGGNATITANMSGMSMTVNINVHDRKVERKESIKVPYGTHEAFVISYQTTVDMGFMSTNTRTVEYWSPTEGLLRIENYNNRNRLEGYTVRTR